ncbi:hypothetical protein MAPG_08446 [Magnaporthiopsis poae ATCC 64411]|uniref:C2H2-type domain-containing protein n=1 Tax=Magnaporthiopsis poae (strain ATCC 64411 / 73-15) TaxID=644358 RepID=A0A0C4E7D3_MAGP6|nr:hypothetical protein MAPG_08446 [Magnaporthiopsis poae ATCC 64411]
MDPSSKPAASTGPRRSASWRDPPTTQSPVPPLSAPPLNASGSTAPRFMMRRSGGGKMTPIHKQPSANGHSPITYEAARPLTNGVKARPSFHDILKIRSDIDSSDSSTSWSFNSTSQNRVEKRRQSAEADGNPNAKRTKDANPTIIVGGNSTTDYIPPHLTTAPDGRKYCHFKTRDGSLLDTYGAIIPGGYTTDVFSEKPWPCPVVDCNTSFSDLPGLGHHFKREHWSATFHDNNDGTLTKKGTYGNKSPTSCAIVITQEKPKTYATAVATAIKLVLSDPQPAAPSADVPDDESSRDSDCDGDLFEVSDHSSPQPSGHISRPEGPRSGSGGSSDRSSDGSSDEDSGPIEEHGTGFSDLPDKSWGNSPPDQAAPRSTQQRSAMETSAAAAPAPPSRAMGLQTVAKSKNGDFSAPMPANLDLMWKYIQQFTVVHRGEIPEKMYVRDFLNLRRLRALEWNDAWIASHRFKDSVPRDVSSMIMQITGPYAPDPCTRCKGGHGPYKGCVTMPPDAPVHPQFMIYGCANCVYHGRQTHCSLRAQSKKEAAERFPHLDPAKVRGEVYSAANAAASRLSAQSKQKAKAAREAQKTTSRVEKPQARETEESLSLAAAAAVAAAEWPTRSRTAKAPNYNLKDLSRSSWHRVGAPSRSASAAEEATEAAKGPDEVNAGTPMDGVEAPAPVLPTRDRLIQDSDKTPTQGKSVSEGQGRETGPNRRENHAAGRRDIGRDMVPSGSGLGGTLEMDDWEFGPGVISGNEDGSDDIAFSSAYLTGQKLVPVAHGVSCRVEFLKPGCSLSLSPETRCTRMCTILAGKVRVQIGDATFSIGFGGNVKIRPGASAVLQNRLYIDAYLQIISVAE